MRKKSEIPSWEEIRQMQVENARAFEEVALRFKETDRRFEKSRAEFDHRLRETDRLINNINKEIGEVSQNIGLHAEQYFKDSLEKDMTFGGVKYDKKEVISRARERYRGS